MEFNVFKKKIKNKIMDSYKQLEEREYMNFFIGCVMYNGQF